jgi:hypothetical protein
MDNIKSKLDQLEARLKNLVEGRLARSLPIELVKSELISRLADAMRTEIQPQEGGAPLAPNVFTLVVHPTHAQNLRENLAGLDELALNLKQAGAEIGLRFAAPIVVKVAADPILPLQGMEIHAGITPEPLADTSTMPVEQDSEKVPTNAFLIVNGTQIFTLDKQVINIGRSSENHLVIDDPRVSRFHAQMRITGGRFVIFDLDSTGGTQVNDRRVKQSRLKPGDVISLAGVPLIFGKDDSPSLKDTQSHVLAPKKGDESSHSKPPTLSDQR